MLKKNQVCITALIVGCVNGAIAAPSVRQLAAKPADTSTSSTRASATTVRAGVLPAAKFNNSTNTTRVPSVSQTNLLGSSSTTGGGKKANITGGKITPPPTSTLESLRQEVETLRSDYIELATKDYVDNTVAGYDETINEKIANATKDAVTSEAIQGAIDTKLTSYDTSTAVTQKISDALTGYGETVDEKIANATKDALTSETLQGAINNSLTSYDTSTAVTQKISDALTGYGETVDEKIANATKDALTSETLQGAINNSLTSYDTSTTVTQKISDALTGYGETVDEKIANATKDAPTNTTIQSALDERLTSYDTSTTVTQKISDALTGYGQTVSAQIEAVSQNIPTNELIVGTIGEQLTSYDTSTTVSQKISNALSGYAKKADLAGMQFKVEDEDVKYSVDSGETWHIIAPVSAFGGQSGEDGCSPTIVSTDDPTNKRLVLMINNCDEYTDVKYIPYGIDGSAGAPGKDACTPHFTATKENTTTTITYTCGDDTNTFAISDGAPGQDAELTLQDITRFKLLTADNVGDNQTILSIGSSISGIEQRVGAIEEDIQDISGTDGLATRIRAMETILSNVANDWSDLNKTTSLLDQ